ncbi:MAG: Amuc_1102 family pilus-like protein [Akkermansiaceae bacterium]
MKRSPVSRPLVALLLGVFALSTSAMAQRYKVEADKPDFDDLQSPEVGGNTGRKNFKPSDWLEAEVKFKVVASSDKVKFVDRVTVKWYVAAKNPDGNGYVLLEKEINHVNVPVGEDIYSSVYLSPTAVKRISGGDRAGKSILSHVGGQILINGSAPEGKTGYFTSKGKPGWWTSGKLSRYDKIPLRNKNETPFKFLWWDRYAEIEERR